MHFFDLVILTLLLELFFFLFDTVVVMIHIDLSDERLYFLHT